MDFNFKESLRPFLTVNLEQFPIRSIRKTNCSRHTERLQQLNSFLLDSLNLLTPFFSQPA